ncbi:DUF4167 domain-containing protein [Holospora obtusa]|uniref:DUF4167 domain-containing protein n=1 Tax=Holospora obtusa TaxID=49893 RepID=UPI00138AD3BB|nr:DUF4167 domain-containing protein [Holospora obtusa]
MNSFKDRSQGSYQFRSLLHRNQKAIKNKHHVFESQGPTGKARGTSVQLVEKYLSLGRDALAMGDTVLSEYFFEYVEHYQRITHDLSSMNQEEVTVSDESPKIVSEEGSENSEKIKKSSRNYRKRTVRSEGTV